MSPPPVTAGVTDHGARRNSGGVDVWFAVAAADIKFSGTTQMFVRSNTSGWSDLPMRKSGDRWVATIPAGPPGQKIVYAFWNKVSRSMHPDGRETGTDVDGVGSGQYFIVR